MQVVHASVEISQLRKTAQRARQFRDKVVEKVQALKIVQFVNFIWNTFDLVVAQSEHSDVA